jgi:predicted RNA-binding protein associated with RNAse of E/G family
MGFWNEQGTFVGWYANLQDPLRWTRFGYDTRDHALDVIIGEDLSSWMLKDEDELAMSVQMGLYTPEEGREIERNGQAVIDMIKAGEAWWGEWRSFEPDPSWPIPVFPDGWDLP